MILLVGFPEDSVLRCYANYLIQRGIAATMINVHHVGRQITIDDNGFTANDQTLKHDDIGGIYSRLFLGRIQDLPAFQKDQLLLLYHYLDCCYERVVNRPSIAMHNFSKLWQVCDLYHEDLQSIATKVKINHTSSHRKDKMGFIMKSISAHRSICQYLDKNDCYEPVILQPDMGRNNIRVHCIGEKVYAQQITTHELDYRYASKQLWSEYSLPKRIAEACICLTKELGLIFSGVDLIERNGQYALLEINPSPGYSYFESHLGQSLISQALTDYLLSLCEL